jgi:hypothetical protein
LSAPAVEAASLPISTGSRLGLLALIVAVLSVGEFVGFMSITGQVPKSIAFRPNLLFDLYIQAPLISGFGGAAAVALGMLALRRTPAVLWGSTVGGIVGIALFNATMVVAFTVMSRLAPPKLQGPTDFTGFPSIAPSPPAIAMGALVIGVTLVMARMRNVSGRRQAIAAMVLGAAVSFYWMFNIVWGLNAG